MGLSGPLDLTNVSKLKRRQLTDRNDLLKVCTKYVYKIETISIVNFRSLYSPMAKHHVAVIVLVATLAYICGLQSACESNNVFRQPRKDTPLKLTHQLIQQLRTFHKYVIVQERKQLIVSRVPLAGLS